MGDLSTQRRVGIEEELRQVAKEPALERTKAEDFFRSTGKFSD